MNQPIEILRGIGPLGRYSEYKHSDMKGIILRLCNGFQTIACECRFAVGNSIRFITEISGENSYSIAESKIIAEIHDELNKRSNRDSRNSHIEDDWDGSQIMWDGVLSSKYIHTTRNNMRASAHIKCGGEITIELRELSAERADPALFKRTIPEGSMDEADLKDLLWNKLLEHSQNSKPN